MNVSKGLNIEIRKLLSTILTQCIVAISNVTVSFGKL